MRSLLSLENFESRASVPFSFANIPSVTHKPTSDADLLRVIDVEIKCAEESDDHDRVEEIHEGFPFEIQDRKGLNTTTLKKNYHGENIEVLVFMPCLVTGDEPETDRKVADDNEEGTRERPSQSSIPLTVNVSKHGGHGLEFCCTAYPDELVIDSMSFKENTESNEEMLAYEGPDFSLSSSFYRLITVLLWSIKGSPSLTLWLTDSLSHPPTSHHLPPFSYKWEITESNSQYLGKYSKRKLPN